MILGTASGAAAGDLRFFRDFVEGRPGEILDAALAVFAEEGFDRGTMRQIAARVGVSEPALYRHFASKDELFDRFVELAGERQLQQVESVLQTVDPTSFPESIRQTLDNVRCGMVGVVPVIKVIATEALRRPSVLAAWREHFVGPLQDRIALVVKRIDAHYAVSTSAEEFAGRVRFVMGTMQGYMITSLLFGNAGADTYLETTMDAMGWTVGR